MTPACGIGSLRDPRLLPLGSIRFDGGELNILGIGNSILFSPELAVSNLLQAEKIAVHSLPAT